MEGTEDKKWRRPLYSRSWLTIDYLRIKQGIRYCFLIIFTFTCFCWWLFDLGWEWFQGSNHSCWLDSSSLSCFWEWLCCISCRRMMSSDGRWSLTGTQHEVLFCSWICHRSVELYWQLTTKNVVPRTKRLRIIMKTLKNRWVDWMDVLENLVMTLHGSVFVLILRHHNREPSVCINNMTWVRPSFSELIFHADIFLLLHDRETRIE